MSENLFEKASRKSWRFQSSAGLLSSEELWSLPLTSATRPSLDKVAVTLHESIKGSVSFVTDTPGNTEANEKLELVKHIIGVRKAEAAEAQSAAQRREERQVLLELKESRKIKALEGLTDEELDKRLAGLAA